MTTSTGPSVPAAFHQLLATHTPDQIAAMVAAVQRPQNVPTASSNSTESNGNVKKRSGPSAEQPRKKTKTAKGDSLKAATRPLNSWMAFRSYYSPMFTSLQQKDISGFLTYLWQADPFKAKWSILAKAYSIIRDTKGKDSAPLDSFLTINAPYIGIVPPAEYLDMLGWKFFTDGNNQTTLTRNAQADTTTFDQDLLTTNLSVNDIIQHSYDSGYISADGGMITVGNESTMTMATTAQPTISPNENQPQTVHAPSQESDGTDTTTALASAVPDNTDLENTTSAVVMAEESAEKDFERNLCWAMAKDLNNGGKKEEVTDHAALLGNNVLGQVLLESGDKFPFNSQFDPEDSTNLHYDPFLGNPFNPFDMSDYLNEDMFGEI
ncbi:MAG: hypothetical protein M1830_000346 [Pleopsidium flavum]|nr:MAG: hypothetical protein M1830_000346 [Pleopsidium flavum]